MSNEKPPLGPHGGRPRGKHIKVWVLPDEYADISERAEQAGLSKSTFLRNVALNTEVRSVIDLKSVADLAKVNGDLGRVAGLLKLWLLEKRGQGAKPSDVEKMMNDFRVLQSQIHDLMGRVVRDS